METKKKNSQFKSFYIPLLLILVIMAGIVAVVTSVNEAKEDVSHEAAEKNNVPVVAAPSGKSENNNGKNVPEIETEEAVKQLETEAPTPETEPVVEPAEPVIPTFVAPVGGVVIKGFSDTVPVFSETMNDYRVHTGVDISGEAGEAVLAAADGTVGAIWDDPLMGKCMTVVHSGEFVTTYKGLNEILPDGIAQGVEVNGGQPIAAIGESALIEIAQEPHVHFEMTQGGVQIDPSKFVTFSETDNYYE